MAYFGQIPEQSSPTRSLSEEYRREELIRMIEHSVENLTLQELEALYYDMSTKNFVRSTFGRLQGKNE